MFTRTLHINICFGKAHHYHSDFTTITKTLQGEDRFKVRVISSVTADCWCSAILTGMWAHAVTHSVWSQQPETWHGMWRDRLQGLQQRRREQESGSESGSVGLSLLRQAICLCTVALSLMSVQPVTSRTAALAVMARPTAPQGSEVRCERVWDLCGCGTWCRHVSLIVSCVVFHSEHCVH